MSKTIIIAVILILLASVGSYFLIQSQTTNTDTELGDFDNTKQVDTITSTNETDVYTLEEVAQHNSRDNCWMIIDDKVYDVTSYMSRHPGGDEILRGCGNDATALFQNNSEYSRGRAEIDLQRLEVGRL